MGNEGKKTAQIATDAQGYAIGVVHGKTFGSGRDGVISTAHRPDPVHGGNNRLSQVRDGYWQCAGCGTHFSDAQMQAA